MENVLSIVWAFLNSAPGVIVVAAVLAYVLGRIYTARPDWRDYEGTIIAAVKYAEKTIPDDVENRSLRRLDEALRYVLKVCAEMNTGSAPSNLDVQRLRDQIQVVHQKLEAAGTL